MIVKRIFKQIITVLITVATLLTVVGCGGGNSSSSSNSSEKENKEKKPIVMVWYPNESAKDYEPARKEFGKLISEATGRPVEQKKTTDYAIAIESIANGTANICFMGAQGYIEANKKTSKVQPLFVNSGPSGTLDDAIYYSFLTVKKGEEGNYKKDGSYSIDNIEGKRMSYVSNSSTSGFKVPTASILSHFSKKDKWKNINIDFLLEGGDKMLFKEVLFGGSHQGSAVNLLNNKADVAAFCDTEIAPYAKCIEGKENYTGSIYEINNNASAPFNKFKGEKFVIIKSMPVLNGPFAYNANTLSPEEVKAIRELFTSDKVTNNKKIFVTKDSGNVGMFKKVGKEHIIIPKDSWFNPIRDLSK